MTALDQVGRRDVAADRPAAAVDRLGQATAIEQARAVAEVQAAIVVAQQVPRDLVRSRQQMLETCGMTALAERSFFRYRRGDSQITGPTIHLARELARCFGNVQYGINELRRDDEHGQSEMLAWAWDVQNNTRSSTTFIVPHGTDVTRDGVKQRKQLTELRDIYENNANNGARRLREQIFAILPTWFTEEAKTACQKTLEDGGGVPLAQRIEEGIEGFRRFDVTEADLVDKLGRKRTDWTVHDVVALGVIYTSLDRGESTREEEFGEKRVTGAEISRQGQQKPAAGDKATQTQLAKIHAMLGGRGIESDEAVRKAIGEILQRPPASRTTLTKDDADTVIAHFEKLGQPPAPDGGEGR